MDNLQDPLVCELSPRPSFEDWKLIAKGVVMTSSELNIPWLRNYIDHEVFGVWYWQNLCMRIGLVTGGLLTSEDYYVIQHGVKLHAVDHISTVPHMVFSPSHTNCDENCYYCTSNLYREGLLREFGFELSKFLGYDGVDASVFDVYANDGVDGYDGDYYTNGGNDDDGEEGDDGDDDTFDNYDDDAYCRGWH
jgi:hypothetical protein